jgi:hypothetical protein
MANKRISENKVVVSKAAAVPARRKSASTKRSARPTPVESFHTKVSVPEVPVAPMAAMAIPAESFQDAVARLAYSYWEARGCQGGSPEADWLRAEFELRAK